MISLQYLLIFFTSLLSTKINQIQVPIMKSKLQHPDMILRSGLSAKPAFKKYLQTFIGSPVENDASLY